jgi:glutamyl-tRNA synthetase
VTQPTARLRFAPSPTGRLHIGGARTALFNWAWARHLGGAFVLRVEDTDRERSTDEYEHAILEGLAWMGLDWDEGPDVGGAHGPYRQTGRLDGYRETAARLEAEGVAYRCFCTKERLTELRDAQQAAGETPRYDGRCRSLDRDEVARRRAAGEEAVLRFAVPPGETTFVDEVRGTITIANTEVDDWVMARADDMPTYNFAVVCDDSAMEITHVVRGEEHIANTPKQLLLFAALGLTPPTYAHLPLMLGDDGKKLSKRTGDTALQAYRDRGFPPEAVFNFLALQGWAPDETTTIFPPEVLVERFEPGNVRKGGSIFDVEKFTWMAGEYLRAEDLARTAERAAPYVVAAGQLTADELASRREWFEAAVDTVRERVRLYSEVPERIAYLFAADDDVPYADKAVKGARKHDGFDQTLRAYLEWLAPRLDPAPDPDALRAGSREFVAERGLKLPALFQPLRCALTGEPGGPDLFEVMALLGPASVRRRLERGIERLSES